MRTIHSKPASTVTIDASGRTLGRVASEAAMALMGKRQTSYRPNVLPKVAVIITNVKSLRFSGKKLDTKTYHSFSGYPGGLKTTTLRQEFEKNPERLVRSCVEHMLPKNRLASRQLRYLTVTLEQERK